MIGRRPKKKNQPSPTELAYLAALLGIRDAVWSTGADTDLDSYGKLVNDASDLWYCAQDLIDDLE